MIFLSVWLAAATLPEAPPPTPTPAQVSAREQQTCENILKQRDQAIAKLDWQAYLDCYEEGTWKESEKLSLDSGLAPRKLFPDLQLMPPLLLTDGSIHCAAGLGFGLQINFHFHQGKDGRWRIFDCPRARGSILASLEQDSTSWICDSLIAWGKEQRRIARLDGLATFPEKVDMHLPLLESPKQALPLLHAGALPLDGPKCVVACLEKPYFGKRGVLYRDLTAAMIPEADFTRLNFRAASVTLPPLDPELVRAVDSLVPQFLAAPAARLEARKKILALGPPAIRPLRPHLKSTDPQISAAVKQVISELQKATQ